MSLARYFVFESGPSWVVMLDADIVGRHETRDGAVRSAIVMADLMGSMQHEADVLVEAGEQLQLAWTYGTDPLPETLGAAA